MPLNIFLFNKNSLHARRQRIHYKCKIFVKIMQGFFLKKRHIRFRTFYTGITCIFQILKTFCIPENKSIFACFYFQKKRKKR